MHQWGYAPTLDALGSHLLGGSVPRDQLVASLSTSSAITVSNDFAYLRGNEGLLGSSAKRVAANRESGPEAAVIAEQFAKDLVAACPFVRCVAVSGSVASGGYAPGDDIDFDLFVESGTKYLCYLLANFLGLRYAWRFRRAESTEILSIPWLPKVTCINVVWPRDEAEPFKRRDEALAFELLRSRPLYGARTFQEVLRANAWLKDFFPQIYDRVWPDVVTKREGSLHRFLNIASRSRVALRAAEVISAGLAWVLYQFVQGTRRRSPQARARMEFLQRVKFPYEVFQQAL